VGIKPTDKIVELCAGKGYLLEFLRKRFPYNKYIGVDLEGCRYSSDVVCMDLNRYDPPKGDIYVFQHCIEHLDQDRVIEILRYCLRHGRAVIGIVPGHHSSDPTHVVNHYHYIDLISMILMVHPKCFYIRPDLLSYVNPKDRDWLIILSNEDFDPVNTFPRFFRYALGILRRTYRYYARWVE